jgi:micrococcal nuclease
VIRSLGLAVLVSAALVSTSAGAPSSGAVVPAATLSVASASAPAGVVGTVIYIADGDTVHVTDALGSKTKVRVLGIDTPETRNPQLPVQCWGPEATQFATATLLHQQVTVVADPTQDARDRFGRLLAYLYLPDGSNYSVLAARAGVARAYIYDNRPVTEHTAIAAAEADARAAGRGLWGTCPA